MDMLGLAIAVICFGTCFAAGWWFLNRSLYNHLEDRDYYVQVCWPIYHKVRYHRPCFPHCKGAFWPSPGFMVSGVRHIMQLYQPCTVRDRQCYGPRVGVHSTQSFCTFPHSVMSHELQQTLGVMRFGLVLYVPHLLMHPAVKRLSSPHNACP